MRRFGHAEVAELLGAYALDALEVDEARQVASHLADCPSCAAEVTQHREVAGLLAAGWLPAPDGVWEQIAEALEENPPPVPDVLALAPARRRRGVWARVATVAAVVAALVIGALGTRVFDDQRRLDDLAVALAGEELTRAANAAANHPDAVPVALRSADGSVEADAYLLPDGTGFLVSDTLAALDPAETYQLWAVVGTAKISLGVLGPDPGVSAFRVVGDVSALAITEEEAGGVVVSQRAPTVVGAVVPA